MNDYECWKIKDGFLEYLDETHTYLYNGIEIPSVTTLMSIKFGNKYLGIKKEVLDKAAQRGTNIHNTIEKFYKNNIDDTECKELRNMKFLQKHYKFNVVDNEVPIVIFKDGKAICAGRLDLVLEIDKELGLGDIKTTSTLDLEYLAYQLNLYSIGYEQCYGKEIHFLKGVHLRNDVRKFKDIPLNHNIGWSLINEYLGGDE